MNAALDQLETERGIPKEKIIEAIADALAAAYKKDYGKRGQIVRATFDPQTGDVSFVQVKTVVDETLVKMEEEPDTNTQIETNDTNKKGAERKDGSNENAVEDGDVRVRWNPEHHILIEDARKMKKDAIVGEEIVFPLETKKDYGRIAAQTAKQVIIQRIREAERNSAMDEFGKRRGEIISGIVQRVERDTVYIDLGRATGVLTREEQIPGEHLRQGDRVRAYLYAIDESAREITLRLSRAHPRFLQKLFELEVPEIASGVVEIKTVAREPGSRSKIAVASHDAHVDPVGSCVGQRGVRVSTVTSELGGEKIDIIEWSADPTEFIKNAISPAETIAVTLDEKENRATIEVAKDHYSLAIGKGGQNARLAARLTGWKIDIRAKGQGVDAEKGQEISDKGQEKSAEGVTEESPVSEKKPE
ncbi:MAG: transcription termination/antitermination protein NusA [Parcubacteria group bacterium]|nr:transcription termination/antitermination protein NusA [Parcubacteria group bacterium]